MKWRNTSKEWGRVTQIFHWGMFFLIVGQFTLAYTMIDLPSSPQKMALYAWHKQMGISLLFLVFLRLWWREINPVPKESKVAPSWDRVLSQSNIWILYILMFLMPLSGLLMSILGGHGVSYFNLFVIPPLMEEQNFYAKAFYITHVWSSYCLLAFVILHILGGLYHHFIWKDTIFLRMFPHK